MFASLTTSQFWNERTARFRWGEVSRGWGLGLALCLFEEHYSLHVHLGWPNIYLRLPLLQRWHREPHEIMESWGGSWVGPDAIHLHWGRRCKIIHMPWSWEWARTSYLLSDGATWVHDLKGFRDRPIGTCLERPVLSRFSTLDEVKKWSDTQPYRYVLQSGEAQERTATIKVHEMEWRWRWFQWLPFPRKISRTIDVKFSDEVGERSGSWKGGCIGCGYELRYDETPQECLRRMEHDRKF